MSEQNNIGNARPVVDFATLELQKDPQANNRFYQVNDHVRVIENQITRDKSSLKGAVYFYPEFLTLGTAIGFFGEDVVLDLLNSRVAGAVYARASASLNNKLRNKGENESDVDYKAYCKKTLAELIAANPVLVTPQDALNFQPGDRELTPKSVVTKIGKLLKEIPEHFSKGEIAKAQEKITQVNALQERLTAMLEQMGDAADQAEANTEASAQ